MALDYTFDGKEIVPLLTAEQLERRIDELAREIARHGSVTTVTVRNGALRFSAALRERLVVYGMRVDDYTIRLGSYGNAMTSSGHVKIVEGITADLTGKDVLVIEDIVDSGRTMAFLLDYLRGKGVRSAKVCALLDKPSRREVAVTIDHCGFSIENLFVVGYGLDYDEHHRELPYVGVVK